LLVLQGTAAMNCEWWQGWRAGENIAIEYRGAEDQNGAAAGVRRRIRSTRVAVIVALVRPRRCSPRRQPRRSPSCSILATSRSGSVLFATLAPPGGNLTADLTAKRFELLREMVPAATRVVMLGQGRQSPHLGTAEVSRISRSAFGTHSSFVAIARSSRHQNWSGAPLSGLDLCSMMPFVEDERRIQAIGPSISLRAQAAQCWA
jgi:hypothetical protein